MKILSKISVKRNYVLLNKIAPKVFFSCMNFQQFILIIYLSQKVTFLNI